MFTLVLVDPKIPQNTGNIARLCAANNCKLHLVGSLGFELDDTKLKRAGLDYWPHVQWQYFEDIKTYFSNKDPETLHLFSSKVTKLYTQSTYKKGDYLIFGSETTGLSNELKTVYSERCLTIPMYAQNPAIRCLNLSNSASIATYEAFRQIQQT